MDRYIMPLSIKMRIHALEKLLEEKNPPDWVRIQYADAIKNSEPEKAKNILQHILKNNSMRPAALNILFNMSIDGGNYTEVKSIANDLKSLETAKPFWIDRYINTLDSGIVELNGIKLIIDLNIVKPHILRSICMGQYEEDEATILLDKLEGDDRVLELGTGLGYLGLLAKKKFPNISYVSFEANPKLINIIKQNQKINNYEFIVRNEVVGKGDRNLDFYICENFWGSSLAPNPDAIDIIKIPEISVNTAMTINTPNFLVVDIEGGETDLVPLLDLSNINKILIELHPYCISNVNYTDILSILINNNFILDPSVSLKNVFYFYKNE